MAGSSTARAFVGVHNISSEIFDILDRTEYRPVRSKEDFDEIGRLRFRAFDARHVYLNKYVDAIIDEIDFDPNAKTFGIYVDEKLVSSIRIHYVEPGHRVSPALEMFPDKLNPLLDQGKKYIDPSRFTVDTGRSSNIEGLHHITMRLAFLATCYLDADFCVSCVKKEHAAFYRRTFRGTLIAGPHRFPGMGVDAVLLMRPKSSFEDVFARFPYYRFLPHEAELLFGTGTHDGLPPLTVLPTARLAYENHKRAAA